MRAIVVTSFGAALALCQASAAVVINEIHYNPDVKTDPGEFVELYNSGTNAVNLAGWAFTDGLNYTFPSVNIAPGAYVVVAQNPSFAQSKYGVTGALGPFNVDGSSGLSSRGERLTLRNAAGQVADQVEYKLGFPWPTVGDSTTPGNGNSIELIHHNLDNDLGGSWRSAGSGAGGTPVVNTTLMAAQQTWKYFKGTSEASSPATAWRQPGFDDSAWDSGITPIGYGEAFVTTVLNDMSGGYTSVFLRKQFTVTDPSEFNQLILEAQYDDGFKMWINGVVVVDNSGNMAAGEVPYSGTSATTFEQGTVAVQAHNTLLTGSSDFFFDARLIGRSGGSSGTGPSPGSRNTVFANNAPPQIRQVEHSPQEPAGGQSVLITAKVTDPNGVASVTLQYQIVNPGSYIDLADAAYSSPANWTTLAMDDNGTGGDVNAADDMFTALIPATVQTHRRLIRYRITVADTAGSSVRVPYADDPQPNFAYFVYNGVPAWSGAVQPGNGGANSAVRTIPAAEMGRLPAFHLIAKSNTVATATWFSRYGGDLYQWGGTLVYDGKVYDHIRYRARGGVWRYSMVKNMWKFDLNRGHDIEIRDNWGRKFKTPWTKLNLGANIQQRDFWHRGEQGMFESVGFRMFQLADVAAPHSAFATFRVIDDALEQAPNTQYEGDFWGMYLAIEQENGRFLEEHDLPDSNLYKMEGGSGDLNNLGPNGPSNKSDLNYILGNYNNASEQWWRTNWNLPRFYSYQTIVSAIHHYDINGDKNFFYYYHPTKRLWEVVAWDLDLTWSHNMYNTGWGGRNAIFNRVIGNSNDGGSAVENGTGPQAGTSNIRLPGARPAFEIELRNRIREIRDLLWNSDEAFRVIDEYASRVGGPSTISNILDADRMMWDYNPKMSSSTYSQNLGKAGQGEYYQFSLERGTNASLQGSFGSGVQIMKNYIGIRGLHLDSLATDNSKPNRPSITYTGPAGYPINRLTFRSGNYSGGNSFRSMRWRVGEITDTSAPNYRTDEPHKYEIETVWDSGAITSFAADITIPANVPRVGSRYRVRVIHTDTTGRNSNWSVPVEFTCGESASEAGLLSHLRITEIMFNPPAGGYEYVELHNSSTTATLDLSGVKFTQGIDYTFVQGTLLLPGGYLVLVGTTDIPGFRAYHGLDGSVTVIGSYNGNLSNGGEQLVLRTSAGGTDIVNFNYGDGRGWPVQADGNGHALVLLGSALAAQGNGAGEYAGNWRASTYLRGSPGRADVVEPASVVLNEITAHTDFTAEFDSNDWIELYNATDAPITLGAGWYLSDDASAYTNLMKWQIPPSTTIPARGWVSFDEVTGFHNPTNVGFGLSKDGEAVYLSYLPGNAQDRVVDAVSFKGQENDWSLGRYPDGGPFWHALTPRTRDTANSAPPERVVISEIMYHPPDVLVGTNLADNSLDEFIEIANGHAQASVVIMTNEFGAWRLNGGVEFSFPTDMVLAASERVLVVNFNPLAEPAQLASFKLKYGITDPALRIFGPYQGKLANNSDRIALERPQGPDAPGGDISWVVVDEVLYSDQSPWACGTDGTGNSLQRVSNLAHGSDPNNWSAEPPTAGRVRANLPPGLPAITAPPQNRIVANNGNASFSVSVCGTPPFTYQWLFNGANIDGATSSTLNLFNVTMADAGNYSVVVMNPAGSLTSSPAALIVQAPPVIVAHPQPVTAVRDQTATFSVTVGGTPPFNFQWRLNGLDLADQTNSTLVIFPVKTSDAGNYSVVVINTAGGVQSANAALTVLIPATVTQQPASITQRLTIASTSPVLYAPVAATFNVTAVGIGALTYQWKFNGVNIPGANSPALNIPIVTPETAGDYTVQVTDDIGPTGSEPAVLTVLVDPIFIIHPTAQIAPSGASVTFSAEVIGYPPPFGFEWRKGSIILNSNASTAPVTFFTTNVFANSAQDTSVGRYRVVVRNLAKPFGVASGFGDLIIADDTDGDGIPDDWESTYFGSSTIANPDLDSDLDTLSNRQEYIAGTDPTNSLSYLKVESIASAAQEEMQVRIEFNAVSNRTYSVLYSENAPSGAWTRVTDVAATATNRVVHVMDGRPLQAPPRFYRLVTPKNP